MVEEPIRRRLAAIFAADVVGYSRLMEANEERTLGALKQHRREFFDPTIVKYDGRIFKVMGDGFLVEFGSVLNAARCAVEIQRGMLERNAGAPEDRHIKFRIGINLGDVIIDGEDVYGDGVNLAARLEGLAGPGGIACSATVRDQVGDKLELEFIDYGEQTVKNIVRPIRVYFVNWTQTSAEPAPESRAGGVPLRSGKPSVAVLPFTNMSNDPEQEFFSDGITEDIITDLSKASGLFVLGRNTVFTYKGKAVNLERIAKELGVAYVVEGSVRKAGQKVRINAQLIDGATGGHIWAERYDGDLSDIFALQDEITLKIVAALKVKLLPAEGMAIRAVPTRNVEAYTYCLRGRELLNKHYKRYYPIARNMFAKAVELDPSFAEAYAGIADCDSYSFLIRQDPSTVASVLENSAKAIELEPDLAAGTCLARTGVLGGREESRRPKPNTRKPSSWTPISTRRTISMDGIAGPWSITIGRPNCSSAPGKFAQPTTNRSASSRTCTNCWAGRTLRRVPLAGRWSGPSASFNHDRRMQSPRFTAPWRSPASVSGPDRGSSFNWLCRRSPTIPPFCSTPRAPIRGWARSSFRSISLRRCIRSYRRRIELGRERTPTSYRCTDCHGSSRCSPRPTSSHRKNGLGSCPWEMSSRQGRGAASGSPILAGSAFS